MDIETAIDDLTSNSLNPFAVGLVESTVGFMDQPGGTNISMGVNDFEMTNHQNSAI